MIAIIFIALMSTGVFATIETSELKRAEAYTHEQKNNPAKAFQLYQEAFLEHESNTRAIHDLALCYKDGYGTKADRERYINLMQKAADLGNPKAMLRMAEVYGAGNLKMALYWIAQAAQWEYAETSEDKRIVQGAQGDLYRNLKRFKKFSLPKETFSLKYKGLHIDVIDLNHQLQTALPRSRIVLTTPTSIAVLPQNDDSKAPMVGILTFLKNKYNLETLRALILGAEDGQLEAQLGLYDLLRDHIQSPDQFLELADLDIILEGFIAKGIKLHHFSKKASKEKAFAQ